MKRVPGSFARRRLFRLATGRSNAPQEVNEEIDLHIDLRTEELIAEGHDPVTARRRATALFGDRRSIEASCTRIAADDWRRKRRFERLGTVRQDLAYLGRSMVRSPAFFTTLILTLALGIGLNAVIVSVVDALLVRPLPFTAPEQLVDVGTAESGGFTLAGIALDAAPVWKAQSAMFRQLEFYEQRSAEYSGASDPASLSATRVTPGMFAMLGVRAALGRTLVESDGSPGAPPVVVISQKFWRERLGGTPNALGSTVTLDGQPLTVVGIMPPGFTFHYMAPEAWLPLAGVSALEGRIVKAVGRLRSTREAAQRQADALAPGLERERPLRPGWKIRLSALGGVRANSDVRAALWMLLAGVGCVMLIACTNAANLLLARSTVREQELSIRQALGAGRGRLFRQVLTESVAVALLSGGLGVVLAGVLLRLLVPLIPDNVIFMSFHPIELDARVLLAVLAVTLLAGVGFGVLPALQSSRRELGGGPAAAGTRVTGSRRSGALRSGLLVVQMGFAVLLLGGAGLLLRSFIKLSSVSPGVDIERLAMLDLQPSSRRYADSTARRRFHETVLERLRAIPGVQGVSAAVGLPPSSGFAFGVEPEVEGAGRLAWNANELLPRAEVDTAYFRVSGTAIVAGRSFVAADAHPGETPVIIDRGLATFLFGGTAPLGRRFRLGPGDEWLTVVGIAETAKLGGPDDGRGRFGMYDFLSRAPRGYRSYLIRTTGRPETVLPLVRQALRELDPSQPLVSLVTMDQAFADAVAVPRFLLLLVLLFAVSALVLAAIGVYGVVSYLVERRRREFAIRIAVGASASAVRRLVMRKTLMLGLLGAALGVGGVLAGGKFLRALLFGIAPGDVLGLGGGASVLVMVALLATHRPARRATEADPMEALRTE